MKKQATKAVKERGGDVSNKTEVLSEYVLQFGVFRGQTFRWMLENALGYTAWLVDSMNKETFTAAALSQNKASFKAYVESFEECRHVIAKKRSDREAKEKSLVAPAAPTTSVKHTAVSRTTSSLAPLVLGHSNPRGLSAKVARVLTKTTFAPNLKVPTRPSKSREPNTSPESNEEEEEQLCSAVDEIEQQLGRFINICVIELSQNNFPSTSKFALQLGLFLSLFVIFF